jgi:TonB family protein
MPDWKQREGALVNGEFPLQRFLGCSETNAVFLTRAATGSAVIRLQPGNPGEAAKLVDRWKAASLLRHSGLLQIYGSGVWTMDGASVAYVVVEHAEENLAELLFERPLTAAEIREMLLQVTDTLAFLHGMNLAHNDLRPSNIFAVGDRIKLSSESVAMGDPGEDMRALGVTVIQAVTQHAPAPGHAGLEAAAAQLPQPFSEIVKGCILQDKTLRWSAARIGAGLRALDRPAASRAAAAPVPPPAALPPQETYVPEPELPKRRRPWVPAGVAMVGAAIAVTVITQRTELPPATVQAPAPRAPEAQTPAAQAPPPIATTPPPIENPEPKAEAPPAPAPAPAPARAPANENSSRDRLVTEDGIANRVIPNVPQKAQETITGKPAVTVLVTVDAAGNVAEASVDKTFSPYFSRLSLEAARRWKFAPQEGAGPRRWTLRFVYSRSNTQATAQRMSR